MATQIEPATQTDEDAFRAEVQQFLADNFPAELKGQSNALAGVDGPTNETPAQTKWREAVGARGWGTPTWPKEYGGGGLTKAQAKIIDQEFAKAGAYNPIGGMGVMMFGPTLLEYGNEDRSRSMSLIMTNPLVRAVRTCRPACEPPDLCRGQGRPLPCQRPGRTSGGKGRRSPWFEPTRATSTRASASC